MLLDTHHHFDFLTGPELRRAFLTELGGRDVRIVAQTLTPSSFVELLGQAEDLTGCGAPLPLWSLGFHPWQATDPAVVEGELAAFRSALSQTRFIGEIGLDFHPRRVETAPEVLQRDALRRLLEDVCRAATDTTADEPYVLSIHAVRCASAVLELLDGLDTRNVVPVFHRFSGTSDELTRLVDKGGYLSVGPHLLATKRGRAYVGQVPPDRLLLETDLPAQNVGPTDPERQGHAHAADVSEALAQTMSTLSELRGDDMTQPVAATQCRLYGLT